MTSSEATAAFHDHRHAYELVALYEALAADAVWAPMGDLLPTSAGLALGGGSGRDAAWLASRGLKVVAAEPASGTCPTSPPCTA